MTTTLGTWRNPPLAYVVAEVVIAPHYSIGAAIPGLQAALRADYPRTIEGQELRLDAESPAMPPPQAVWRLLSADQHLGVHLGPHSIAFHATRYQNSSDFLGRWAELLEAVDRADLGAYVERVGLRYVDLIVPSEGRAPADYLASGLQGLTLAANTAARSAIWLAEIAAGEYNLSVRTAAPLPEGAILPPNFVALPLRKPAVMAAAEQRVKDESPLGLIDVDCIGSVQSLFDPASLAARYTQMQQLTSSTFKSLLSDLALEEWR